MFRSVSLANRASVELLARRTAAPVAPGAAAVRAEGPQRSEVGGRDSGAERRLALPTLSSLTRGRGCALTGSLRVTPDEPPGREWDAERRKAGVPPSQRLIASTF